MVGGSPALRHEATTGPAPLHAVPEAERERGELMSDDWTDMTQDEATDLVGKRVRVVWKGACSFGLRVKDCCETLDVDIRPAGCPEDEGHGFTFHKRVKPKSEEDRPLP